MDIKPVIPFEPVRTDTAPSGERWVAQVKWDGVRILTYYDGRQTRLFNRKLNERTIQFPELTAINEYCAASSVILDGEVIALEKGRPSFQQVMRRDGVRQPDKVPSIKRAVPVIYMVFDLLYLNGEWVTGLPLAERQQLLSKYVTPQDQVQLVENIPEADALFAAVCDQDLEGIVCKDLGSKYLIRGKDARWQKIKNYQDVIAVIGGVTFRGNLVNAVLLGLYDDDGKFRYIGHAGTGKLSAKDWRELTERIKSLITERRPFQNKPERIKTAVWLQPTLAAKIRFIEWTSHGTLRQPSIQALVETDPKECKFELERHGNGDEKPDSRN